MIGITSYGGYLPRLRLNRMSIVEQMGWLSPAIVMVADGERSFGNWDEDALTMAVAAARDCLSGRDKSALQGLYLASTTLPFADRLNAGVVKTALNLGEDMVCADITSSQRAGTTALVQALSSVKSGDQREAMVAAADMRQTKTAYFYEMWFGDGAAALAVGKEGVIAQFLGSHSLSRDFVDHYRGAGERFDYMWEERWVRDQGYAQIIPAAVEGLFHKLGAGMDEVDRLIFPCFFKAEHRKIAAKLGAAPEKVAGNLHEVCGETGAAHPLVMLVKALEEAAPGERILVCGFGQGCDALLFQVSEAIRDLPSRRGINGCLDRGRTVASYTKFLKFRGLVDTEMGIRAEAPTQTAMTVLHRRRTMLMGMVGGKCGQCGVPQFPRADICINPACRASGSQEPYEFASQPARVKSFTGDLLAVSVDPPAVYGMVEFENGGRYMADFTDCEIDGVAVGQPVELAFRRRYLDAERGFSGYFWKAIPQAAPEGAEGQEEGLDFSGQVAIVTGAGSGLGRAYALELARRGARVLVNDLGVSSDGSGASRSPADLVVAEITQAGGEALSNYDSVATAPGGAAIVQAALDAWGRVDVLINNAGILRDKTLVKMEPEMWQAVLEVHLSGAYHVTRPAFAAMKGQGYGRIVFTTSAASLYGNFGQTNYSAAKLGLVGFANTLKLEGESSGVKVNTVAPIAGTRLTQDLLPPDLFARLKPEFVAPLVVYLSSRACVESGMVFNAGMGYFNRAAILTSPGLVLGMEGQPSSLGEIHRRWEEIDSLENGEEYSDLNAALTPMLKALDSKKNVQEPQEITAAHVFSRLAGAFTPHAAPQEDLVFQFNISGERGGEWFAAIADGACVVEAGQHENPTTVIKMTGEDFLALVSGGLNAMTAYTSGKLRIEGDILKSQLVDKVFDLKSVVAGDVGLTPETAPPTQGEKPGGSPVAKVFQTMPAAFQADSAQGVEAVLGFAISGPGGGNWAVTVKNQACTVEEGTHPAPDATIGMAAGDFLALMSGRLDAMAAFGSGKLEIQGDLMKSQLIAKLFKFSGRGE